MRIACDFDDVLFDFIGALLKFHNRNYNTNYKKSDVKSYFFNNVWGGTLEEAIEKVRIFSVSPDSDEIPPIPNSVDSIEKLYNHGTNNELFVVTSRKVEIREKTLNLLNKHFPGKFNEIYFSANHYGGWKGKTKAEICKELNVDYMIEDSAEYSIDIPLLGTRTFLIDNPWNKTEVLPEEVQKKFSKTLDSGLIKRVFSWNEITDNILNNKF